MRDKSITNMSLDDRTKIVFPPLHRKLGLIKQFLKDSYKEGHCFQYIKASFSSVSEEKMKAWVFDGPPIGRPIKDPNVISSMNNMEANAWKELVNVVLTFMVIEVGLLE